MNVQKLNIILEALRCGSITKAAEELGYTQSGLTYAINSLESELGFPVVIRDSGGIRLSREGQELLPLMEEMVECEKRLADKAKFILGRRGRVLNVAAYPSISMNVLPPILADFNCEEPDVKVNLMVGSRDEIINWLLDGTVDFGLGGQVKLAGVESIPLLSELEFAILPDDFPDNGMTVFPMEEFRKHPFIQPVCWAEEEELIRQLENYGIEPQFIVGSTDNAPVIAMVEQGIGISAIPRLTIPFNPEGIKIMPIDPPCNRRLVANYRSSCTDDPAAAAFLKCIERFSEQK